TLPAVTLRRREGGPSSATEWRAHVSLLAVPHPCQEGRQGEERAKAAIDRSRTGSTGSARMAQCLAAADMQPAVRAPTQGVYHHQGGAATVLALVSFLSPGFAPPSPPPGPAPMTLTATVAAAGMTRPWAAAPRQLRLGGRRRRLAVDLQDQHLAVIR